MQKRVMYDVNGNFVIKILTAENVEIKVVKVQEWVVSKFNLTLTSRWTSNSGI